LTARSSACKLTPYELEGSRRRGGDARARRVGGRGLDADVAYAATRTSTCLYAHKALWSRFDAARFLPRGARPRPVDAISAGFPFSPAPAALDTVIIGFMKNPAEAVQGRKALVSAAYAEAAHVQGITREGLRAYIAAKIKVQGNAVVVWKTGPHPSSQATVARCLR
jgi:hypothetical protein